MAALAGCGGEDPVVPVPVPGPGGGPSVGARVGATPAPAITDGRLGDATTGQSGRPDRVLDRGGRVRPGRGTPPVGAREGVDGAAGCGDVDQQPAAGNLTATTTATVCLLNAERTSRGLASLASNGKLDEAAAAQNRDMLARSFFAHQSPDGRTPADRIRSAGYIPDDAAWTVGENLAWGSGALATPRAIVRAWMDSPGHRDNILRPAYRELGVSVVLGVPKAGVQGGATYTTTFGALTRESGRATTISRPSGGVVKPRTAKRRRLSRAARLRAARLRAARARSGARWVPKR